MLLYLHFQSPESDYDTFSAGATKTRRREAEKLAPKPTADVVLGQKFELPVASKGVGGVGGGGGSNSNSKSNGKDSISKAVSPSKTSPPPLSPSPAATGATPAASTSSLANNNSSLAKADSNVDTFVPDGGIDFFLDEGDADNKGSSAAAAATAAAAAAATPRGLLSLLFADARLQFVLGADWTRNLNLRSQSTSEAKARLNLVVC